MNIPLFKIHGDNKLKDCVFQNYLHNDSYALLKSTDGKLCSEFHLKHILNFELLSMMYKVLNLLVLHPPSN